MLHKEDGEIRSSVEEIPINRLPEGDTLVDIDYSSVNYKDALAVTGTGAIIRGDYPFVPGIDLVGRIISTDSFEHTPGDVVIGTGWGLGEKHWGGYAGTMRVQSKWLVPLPEGMSPLHAMALGTAGFTAMLSVMALEDHHVTPDSGPIVITGATGGVGSLSVALLNRLGYEVIASTGKKEAKTFLESLGAHQIMDRDQLGQGPQRPLDRGHWAGAVDSVGGATLSALLSQTKRHGAIAACGLAGGASFESSVYPFILRGVNLLGIDSNTCPYPRRVSAWNRLNELVAPSTLEAITEVIPLTAVPQRCETLLAGQVKGRTVVDTKSV